MSSDDKREQSQFLPRFWTIYEGDSSGLNVQDVVEGEKIFKNTLNEEQNARVSMLTCSGSPWHVRFRSEPERYAKNSTAKNKTKGKH